MHTVKGRAAGILQTPRPFQCKWHEGCSKSFNRKSDLQRHYRIHTNERPYACDYKPCEKTFIQRSALTVHRRTHTGDKPHKCPYTGCGKCFSDSSSLARHRRIHTNDKPYICKNPHCRKAFCRKTTMTKHFRKEHPSESLDGDDDADYSDIDESEEDVHGQSTELSREGSHAAFQQGTGFRDTPPAPRRASTYSADLWSLPGHSAQTPPTSSGQRSMKPRCDSPSEFMKMERAAQPPHRTCTDPFPNVQGGHFMPPATSLGGSVHVASSTSQPHPADGSMQSYIAPTTGPGMWPANAVMSDSPNSIDSVSSGFDHPQSAYNGQAYQGRPLNYSFGQHINQYQAHGQAAELQPVQDIILDEPSQPPHFNALNHSTPEALQQYNGVAAQRIPEHSGQARSLHIQGQAPNAPNKSVNAAFTDGIPSTPVSAHSLPYSSAPELPYQEQQVQASVPFNGYEPAVTFPPKNPFSYYSGWDKEAKDDAWGTMPSQVSFN